MDKEVVELCRALNSIDGVSTTESCCGHGEATFRVWFEVKDIKTLNLIMWAGCHRWWDWYDGWDILVDCADPYRDSDLIGLLLVSHNIGTEAYEKADNLARGIDKFITEYDPAHAKSVTQVACERLPRD